MKKSSTRTAVAAMLALSVCAATLAGNSFAWFTDNVASSGNIIKSGRLEVGMNYAPAYEDPDTTTAWKDAEQETVFKDSVLWEPGYTEAYHIQVLNNGNLALKYYLAVLPKGEPDDVADLAEAIDVYYKSPACQITDRAEVSQKLERIGTLREVMSDGSVMSGVTQGHLSAGDSAALCTLALKMQETAGNDYQDRAVNSSFDIKLYATQWTEESDSFDDQYDKDATFFEPLVLTKDGVKVTVPGSAVNETDVYALVVGEKTTTPDDAGDVTVSLDISLTKNGKVISTPDAAGTVFDVEIDVGKHLSIVSVTHKGTEVDNYGYDPETGIVSLKVSSFSNFSVKYANARKITFNANGATGGTMDDQWITIGTETPLNKCSFTWEDHTFEGWALTAGGQKKYQDEEKITLTDNLQLYAVWCGEKYPVDIMMTASTLEVYDGTKKLAANDLVASGTVLKAVVVEYTGFGEMYSETFSIRTDNNTPVPYYSDEECTQLTTSQAVGTYYFRMPAEPITVGTNGSCLAAGTMITLADGSSKAVEDVTAGDRLLVWDLETGSCSEAAVIFNKSMPKIQQKLIHVCFSDGTDVTVAWDHGFFDVDLGRYIYINNGSLDKYTGHRFFKLVDKESNAWETVTLERTWTELKETDVYSPVVGRQFCYFTEGILSVPGISGGIANIFEVDTDSMTYDKAKMEADISKYGIAAYEEFESFVPYDIFEAFNGKWMKISLGKGLTTMDELKYLVSSYGMLCEI